MKNVMLITGELYPTHSGASLHTYGYCKSISEISNFVACSLYYDNVDIKIAMERIQKDFLVALVRPYQSKIEKIKAVPTIIYSNYYFMYPVYQHFYKVIKKCIIEKKIDIIIIDHVTMDFYFRKLKREFPELKYIYNSHNVEYANIYDRHVKRLADKHNLTNRVKYWIENQRYQAFRKIEKDLIEQADAVMDISQADIEQLRKEYGLKQKNMFLAKPMIHFRKVKKSKDVQIFNKRLLIVGSMSWYPNENGIVWFVDNVFSKLIEKDSGYQLFLVGRGASERIGQTVKKFSDNIQLIGEVSSTEDYFEKCDLSIVPIFEGTGAKLKVLESLARGIPTVCSGFAAKDYGLTDEIPICNTAEDYIKTIIELENNLELRNQVEERIEQFMSSYYVLNHDVCNLF